jgi:hypothetical protein
MESRAQTPASHYTSRQCLRTLHSFLLASYVMGTISLAQNLPDIKILNEDAHSISLEFTPQFLPQKLKSIDGKDLRRTAFGNEIFDDTKPGSPWITYRGIPLQFPSRRAVLTITEAEFHTVKEVPLPIPGAVRKKDFGLSPLYRSGPVGAIPHREIAQLVDVAASREKFIGTLRFYPVQLDKEKGEAKLFTKIVVQISFDQWADPSTRTSRPTAGDVHQKPTIKARTARERNSSDSPLANGTWYKMKVMQTGIYKIDQALLEKANIPRSSIGNINSVRVFGNGGRMLPEDLSMPRPNGLEEVAREVVDNNGNGEFDAGDYVLFYGRSTRGWTYDSARKLYNHCFSYYCEPDYYFFTFGGANGMAMDSLASTNGTGAFSPTDFQEKILLKQEMNNLMSKSLGGGAARQWVGQQFKYDASTAVYTTSLPGYVPDSPVDYRFVFLSRSATIDTFTVYESGTQLGSPVLMFAPNTVFLSGDLASQEAWAWVSPQILLNGAGLISNNRSVIKIVFGTSNTSALGWIDYMDLFYRRSFDARGGALLFDSPDTTAVVQYTVHGLSSGIKYAFEVTDHKSVRRITQARSEIGTDLTFQLAQNAGELQSFAVVDLSGMMTPTLVGNIPNTNLHGTSPGADFVIVSPAAFVDEAERLAAFRQEHDSLKTLAVTIDDIYNEFSGGLLDPMAVRDFLRYAVTNWSQKPQYVLLFGGGHFDYKNILSSSPNWIPPYESLESIVQLNTYASDDFFAMLNAGNPRISLPIGRIPARSLEEATSAVDKIVSYETKSPFDTWRNRIVFVGDDGLTSTTDDGSMHTAQAEDLANNHTPDSFEKRKIYLSEYPTVLSATGRTKPQVNKDIVAAVNRGALILNFSGHGNSTQWTHEAVFTQTVDIPHLTNSDRLTFVVAATCNFGQYDLPNVQSAGEQIVVMNQGGAIAEVTASREAIQSLNKGFNTTLYDNLFPRDARGNPPRLGDAMWLTKQVCYQLNDIKFHLFADPTTRLNVPRATVTLDSVNDSSTTHMVTMKSLGKVTVTGHIEQTDSSTWSTFNGTGIFEVFDSQQKVMLRDIDNYPVTINGSILYRGEVTVNNGFYRTVFPIPKDVTYGGRSRMSFYVWNGTSDGIGYTENVTINGTDTTATAETTGPSISVYLDDETFRPGDRVKANTNLIVDLESANGINTSSAGIGHQLQATLNKTTTINLTDYYRGDLDTYERGEIRYPMMNLADGPYTLSIKAWDIRNNSSEAETYFVVSSNTDLEMANVVNFPNPFSRSTTFTFQRNSVDPIDVEVKIYSIAGRLVQSLRAYAITDRFVRVPWDGRDRDGDQIANGVYIYRVIATSHANRTTKEETGKLVIMK